MRSDVLSREPIPLKPPFGKGGTGRRRGSGDTPAATLRVSLSPLLSSKGVQRDDVPLPRVWGCPPIYTIPSPKNGGSRGLTSAVRQFVT